MNQVVCLQNVLQQILEKKYRKKWKNTIKFYGYMILHEKKPIQKDKESLLINML